MPLFVSSLKLKAAAHSMHQMCPAVRGLFPDLVEDRIVETATAYLYGQIADDVFGPRFSAALRARLRNIYKYAEWHEVESRVGRIERNIRLFNEQEEKAAQAGPANPTSGDDEFTRRVRSVIRALLYEAGSDHDDFNVIRHTFPRFDAAVRRIKSHQQGISKQPHFVMRK